MHVWFPVSKLRVTEGRSAGFAKGKGSPRRERIIILLIFAQMGCVIYGQFWDLTALEKRDFSNDEEMP